MQCAKHLRIVVVLAMQREKNVSRKELDEIVKAYTQMEAASSAVSYAIATHSWLTASLGGGPMQ